MAYQQAAEELATASQTALVAAFTSLSATGFIVAGASLLASFNATAAALADLSLAALLRTLPLGIGRPDDDVDRIERSLTTLLARTAPDPFPLQKLKIERIARSEPLNSGMRAYRLAMLAREDRLQGWRRVARPDACELCRSLADGSILPVAQPMHDHINCSCIAEPVPA